MTNWSDVGRSPSGIFEIYQRKTSAITDRTPTKLTNQNKAKYKLHHGNTTITIVDNRSFIFIPNYPFICLIVASLLLSQVVEFWKAGQPSFPIHPVRLTVSILANQLCVSSDSTDEVHIVGFHALRSVPINVTLRCWCTYQW